MATKRKGIWRFFSPMQEEPSKAKCDLCNKKVSRGSAIPKNQTTSSMLGHLKAGHKEEYELYKGGSSDDKSAKQMMTMVFNFRNCDRKKSVTKCFNSQ